MKQFIHGTIILGTLTFLVFTIDATQELLEQGDAYSKSGQHEQAIACYKKNLETQNSLTVRQKIATSSMAICAWDKAVEQFKIIQSYLPNNPQLLYTIAYALKEGQRPQEAILYYKKLIELKPDHRAAHFGLSLCYLILEQFDEGFKELAWCSPDHAKFPLHNWKDADLSGMRIIIRTEWGMGDHIQFIRYAQWLKDRDATVIMQTYPPLVQLLSACPFLDKVIPTRHFFPEHDAQIPLMDLMRALGATKDNIPTDPYVFANPDLIELWRKKLPKLEVEYEHKPFRIGLCWAGRGGENITEGLRKDIPLEKLASIAQISGVKLYSLQKINNVDELEQISFRIHTFDESFDRDNGRFMDTAAVMKNLDLVLTVDTSVVHLAGALGVRAWVMIPETADWRWFTNKTGSPWYPTVSVFRQQQAGNWDAVVQQVKEELENIIQPNNKNPQYSIQQAKYFFSNKEYDKALEHIKTACEQDPNNPVVWLLFANIYNQIGQPDNALSWYKKYIETQPSTASTFRNAGLAFRRAGKYHEAIELYKKSLEIDPENDTTYFGLGKAYLAIGDFEQGLPAYERGRTPQVMTDPNFLHDIRQIAGKTILIRPDWGLGDMIQFVRYAKLIKKQGGNVFLLPHKALDPLLRSCPYIDRVVTYKLNEVDKQVCPMSLPYLFKTTVETIPDEIPYLYAEPKLVLDWQKKLAHDDGFKIGLCWESKVTNLYPRKDIPLEQFKKIAQIPGIHLYSLQKMNGTQQPDAISFTVHSFGQDFDESHGRFMDTAAIMKNLDLIISVDTATAHLAGALGVPVWILLPYAADWRWLTKRKDSPWYPTARLFRQQKPEDWTGVLERVKKELEAIMNQHKSAW